MENHQEEQRKYELPPHRNWTERAVLELRERNICELYDGLSSVMHDDSLSASWKLQLAFDLLNHERDVSRRARVWDCLAICAREIPEADFRVAASLAWKFVDSFSADDVSNSELNSAQDFLNDWRIFAFGDTEDFIHLKTRAISASRFDAVPAIRAICTYFDIASAGRLAIRMAEESDDFVLREAGIDGISCIYTRPNCNTQILGQLNGAFRQVLSKRSADSHWYVRKATKHALFFKEECR